MSNHFAIATVTASLRNYLLQTLPTEVPGATVTAVRPDAPTGSLPRVGANIYLYQISSNPALSVQDWPTRTSTGSLEHPPRIGINLHYLLTFYGSETELEPQRVMAGVIHRMNAQPWLDPDFIRRTLSLPDFGHLAGSDLADSSERVKFTPLHLSLEELTKLWTVFQDASYTLSLAYLASVVVLETPAPARRPLPVFERSIRVSPFARIRLTEAYATGPTRYDTVEGATIRIKGDGFTEPLQQVEIGEVAIATLAVLSSSELEFTLTHADLRAGAFSLRVKTAAGYVSNSLPFLVRPTPSVTSVGGGRLTVGFSPSVGRAQRVQLILHQLNAPSGDEARTHVIAAPSENGITDPVVELTSTIEFDVGEADAGDYLLRVSVDGAENLLERTEVSGALTITGPQVSLP